MSTAWKRLEQDTARLLHGRRVTVPWDLFERRPDVIDVDGFPELVIDAKLRRKWTHHSLLRAVAGKYCRPEQIPMLVTRQAGRPGAVAVVPLDWLASLMDEVREARKALDAEDLAV